MGSFAEEVRWEKSMVTTLGTKVLYLPQAKEASVTRPQSWAALFLVPGRGWCRHAAGGSMKFHCIYFFSFSAVGWRNLKPAGGGDAVWWVRSQSRSHPASQPGGLAQRHLWGQGPGARSLQKQRQQPGPLRYKAPYTWVLQGF